MTLSLTGLPQGATGTFGTNPTTGTSVLTLNVGAAVATGSYSLTVTGTSGTLSHSTPVTLVVTPAGSFSLSATPASLPVPHAKSREYTVTITRTAGFSGAVSLSVSGLPPGVSGTFNRSTMTGTSSTLTINAAGNAQRGTSTLTITGTSTEAPTANTTVSLTIR